MIYCNHKWIEDPKWGLKCVLCGEYKRREDAHKNGIKGIIYEDTHLKHIIEARTEKEEAKEE